MTDRLLLRTYTLADADAVLAVIGREEIYRTTYAIPHPYPRERLMWWFRKLETDRKEKTGYELGIFLRENGRYVGNCGFTNLRRDNRSGVAAYFIDPQLWGRGYATQALKTMLPIAFDRFKLERLSASCMRENPASRRVLEKAGFKYEGTARRELCREQRFYDVEKFSLLREEYHAQHGEKRTFFTKPEKKVDKRDKHIL